MMGRDLGPLVLGARRSRIPVHTPQGLGTGLRRNPVTNGTSQVQGIDTTTGEGFYEGLNWLDEQNNK
jgi:hypothetical protein